MNAISTRYISSLGIFMSRVEISNGKQIMSVIKNFESNFVWLQHYYVLIVVFVMSTSILHICDV